jgi:hypothetical protein
MTTTEQPTSTPIENRIDWARHRAAADAVRARGGHWSCSQAIGFAHAHRDVKPLEVGLGKPCPQCLGIWQSIQKQQEEA